MSMEGARAELAPHRSLPDGRRFEIIEHADGNRTVAIRRSAIEPPPAGGREGEIAWYVPYTAVHPWTAEAVPAGTTWIDVSGSNIAYYAALRDIWGRGESFALLEHDVVCRPDVVAEFEACPELWCVYEYSDFCCRAADGVSACREGWRNLLGCTRFRAELIAAVPDAMDFHPDRWDWHNMCDGLGENLRAAGFTHHWHGPPVEHHRETHRIGAPCA